MIPIWTCTSYLIFILLLKIIQSGPAISFVPEYKCRKNIFYPFCLHEECNFRSSHFYLLSIMKHFDHRLYCRLQINYKGLLLIWCSLSLPRMRSSDSFFLVFFGKLLSSSTKCHKQIIFFFQFDFFIQICLKHLFFYIFSIFFQSLSVWTPFQILNHLHTEKKSFYYIFHKFLFMISINERNDFHSI